MNEYKEKREIELNQFEALPQSETESHNSNSLITQDYPDKDGIDDVEYRMSEEEVSYIQEEIIRLPNECWGKSKPRCKMFGWQIIKGPGFQCIPPIVYITLLLISIPAFNILAYCIEDPTYKIINHLLAITLAFLIFRTTMVDPGFVTRKTYPELVREYPYKFYCTKCMVTMKEKKMKKIYHCMDCDRCNFEHDHHCVILGMCIGKNNLYYFYATCLFFIFFNISCFNLLFSLLQIEKCRKSRNSKTSALLEVMYMALTGNFSNVSNVITKFKGSSASG